MTDEYVHVERRPDGVALVTLDRPKANALSVELLTQLEAVFEALAADLPGAVVIWGGPRIFAAGADISGLRGPEEAFSYGRHFRAAFDRVAGLPRTVIAAVSGYALGGGCELALACDLRVVGETATLGQPEVQLGIIPGAGGTQRLSRLVGPGRAKDLVLTGRHVGADEALRIGLAEYVAPADGVLDAALDLASAQARGPLVAQQYAKLAIDRGLDGTLGDGLEIEAELFVEVFRTDDASDGVRSFLEQGPGKATFRGR